MFELSILLFYCVTTILYSVIFKPYLKIIGVQNQVYGPHQKYALGSWTFSTV